MRRSRKGSYEWITLRATNINFVADKTGQSKEELKALLDAARKQGTFEINIPMGVKLFTREEK